MSFSMRRNQPRLYCQQIVVARAEQAHAERAVLEQEAAKVGGDRLDADAQAVEVVALGDIAQVLVDEQALDADESLRYARQPRGRVGFQDAGLLDATLRQVEDRQEAEFPVGRSKHGVALVRARFRR